MKRSKKADEAHMMTQTAGLGLDLELAGPEMRHTCVLKCGLCFQATVLDSV